MFGQLMQRIKSLEKMDRVPLQDKLRMRESAHWGHDYRGMVEEFGNSRVWKGSLHVGEWSGCESCVTGDW